MSNKYQSVYLVRMNEHKVLFISQTVCWNMVSDANDIEKVFALEITFQCI